MDLAFSPSTLILWPPSSPDLLLTAHAPQITFGNTGRLGMISWWKMASFYMAHESSCLWLSPGHFEKPACGSSRHRQDEKARSADDLLAWDHERCDHAYSVMRFMPGAFAMSLPRADDVRPVTDVRFPRRFCRFISTRVVTCAGVCRVADRSGWPVVHQWRREPTTREVVKAVVSNFFELGVPMRFRSDDGPQLNAGIFQDTLWR